MGCTSLDNKRRKSKNKVKGEINQNKVFNTEIIMNIIFDFYPRMKIQI